MADESVAAVHALGRRDPGVQHPKLVFHAVDFTRLPALPRVDEVYLALGTTIKAAGSQPAFRAVDYEANLAVARAAKAAGAKRLGLVSAMGADARSSVFYSRTKGELEDALTGLGYDALVIARPSMLTGDRSAVGQPARSGEEFALKVSRWLSPVIPDNYKSVESSSVAKALLAAVPTSKGKRVMLSGELRRY